MNAPDLITRLESLRALHADILMGRCKTVRDTFPAASRIARSVHKLSSLIIKIQREETRHMIA